MKKILIAATAALCMIAALPVSSLAATESYVTSDRPVKAETELRGANAPKLIIEKSSDHRENFSFDLKLTNAEWLYEGSGEFEPGIKYTVLTSRNIIVEVDLSLFDARYKNMSIPIEAKIDGAGTADITIDPRGSTVSAGTYTFAHVSFPAMAVGIANVDTKNGTFEISFNDSYPYSMAKGRIFKLTLNNGFTFVSSKEIEGTGKYAGIVNFKIDSKDKSIAYLELEEYSALSAGTIKIKGIQTASSDSSEDKTTSLYVEPVYGEGGTVSFNLGFFSSSQNIKTGTPVLFTIGKTGYVVDEDMVYETDASPYIDLNGRTMLPLRALANAFNISDENIKWDDVTKTVTLTNKAGKLVVVTVNSTQLRVGAARITMDTTAVIKDGRTYLPMRAVLNALGIADDDIIWNDTEKSVLVYNK